MSVTQIILLLLAGYTIFTIDKKQKNVPVPTVLFIAGIALSFIPYFNGIGLTKETLYGVFLPALIFISAYQFSTKALKKNGGIIAMLSTVGLILTAVLLGFFTYALNGALLSISFIGALIVAAVLTPTDPVSVVSILKKSSDDPSIADVVEGESMINDGTSIVLFSVLLGMFTKGASFDLTSFLGEFLYVAIGGVVIGAGLGWLVSKAVHITAHKEYQVMLSIILAYGGFHLAEHLGVSGVLATVTSGLMLSWEFGHVNKEDHYREALDGFWDVIEPTLLSLVFLLIGIEWTSFIEVELSGAIFLLFLASVLIRGIVIIGSAQFFPGWRKSIDWKKVTLMSWSGIKGTMSIVLLLSFEGEAGQNESTILALCSGVIFLSLIVQSIGIYPLSQLLKKA